MLHDDMCDFDRMRFASYDYINNIDFRGTFLRAGNCYTIQHLG